MTASRGIVPPPIPVAHAPLPTVYLAEMTTVRGRQWWASLPNHCQHCAEAGKSNRLFLDAPIDIRDAGRVYCQACTREAATVEMRRPLYQRGTIVGDDRPLTAMRGRCVDCGVETWKATARRCRSCAGKFQSRLADTNRPLCEVCGKPSLRGKSRSFCEDHVYLQKRGIARRMRDAAVSTEALT